MFEREVIGEYGLILGGAAGDEIDRVDSRWGTPPHALVLASSQGRHSDSMQITVEDIPVTHPNVRGTLSDDVRADLVFMETGSGGAVFSVGSMNWAGSLSHNNYDNDLARVTTNVLRRFRDPVPFPSDLAEISDPIVSRHLPPFGLHSVRAARGRGGGPAGHRPGTGGPMNPDRTGASLVIRRAPAARRQPPRSDHRRRPDLRALRRRDRPGGGS